MIYIPIGMYLAHNKISKKLYGIMFVGGFIVNYFIDNEIFSSFILVVTSIGFFGIVECVKLNNSNIYGILRNMSTRIYLIHMYVWTFYYLLMYGKKTYGIDSFIVVSMGATIVAIIHYWLKKNRSLV